MERNIKNSRIYQGIIGLGNKELPGIFGFRHVRIYLMALFVLNFLAWLATNHINMIISQDLVVLHYNVDFGVNLIGSVKRIFIIPALGLLIILFNLLISFLLVKHKDFKFISHLLLASAIMVHLFLLASLASIYLVNFR